MERVEIQFRTRDVATRICDMRSWLDDHGCQPISFILHEGEDGVKAFLAFGQPTDATAFAARFGGCRVKD